MHSLPPGRIRGCDAQVGEALDDDIGLAELADRISGGHGDDAHPRGFAGADAGGRILDDDAVAGSEAQCCRALEIRFGVGLAVGDVAGRDHGVRDRKADGAQASGGQVARAGGYDRPAVGRNTSQQIGGPSNGAHPFQVGDFTLFHGRGFGVGVELGRDFTDGLDGRTAVGDGDNPGGIEMVLARPDSPLALDGGAGVNENAVEVEENGGGGESFH